MGLCCFAINLAGQDVRFSMGGDEMKVILLSEEEKQEYVDMQLCYKAIKAAREILRSPVKRRVDGVTYTSIPMAMWEVLQPVIEVVGKE